ncbi:hypothetical protein DM01DRAFT_1332987, partial [Hesseltinella vesiculosa]
ETPHNTRRDTAQHQTRHRTTPDETPHNTRRDISAQHQEAQHLAEVTIRG